MEYVDKRAFDKNHRRNACCKNVLSTNDIQFEKKEHGSLIVPIPFSTSLISQESDTTKLREYEAQ